MSENPNPSTLAPGPAVHPGVPSPAVLAGHRGTPAARSFGRIDDDGVVYVRTADGERAVGSYPGASPQDAIGYFVRKFEELDAVVDLLLQRLEHTDISAKDAREAYTRVLAQADQANAVGDFAALQAKVDRAGALVEQRHAGEVEERMAAREQAKVRREEIVAEAERIAAEDPDRVQWKTSGSRMRELLDQWKAEQRGGARLDKESEAALWHRFSAARTSFDKARRSYFAQLDTEHSEAKQAKERLVAQAEALATSTDWAATAGEFKGLMSQWRRAGRANRRDDDALWQRFKTAQDAFFAAKDATVAAQDEAYRENLTVKEALVVEAEAILPVTDLEAAKAALRSIQDRWDAAGRVPRADMDRIERALKRVEQAVRDADSRRWASTNPEAAARARSLVEQLESSVAELERDRDAAAAKGDERALKRAEEALAARRQWLDQARAGLDEFGG